MVLIILGFIYKGAGAYLSPHRRLLEIFFDNPDCYGLVVHATVLYFLHMYITILAYTAKGPRNWLLELNITSLFSTPSQISVD